MQQMMTGGRQKSNFSSYFPQMTLATVYRLSGHLAIVVVNSARCLCKNLSPPRSQLRKIPRLYSKQQGILLKKSNQGGVDALP